MKIILNDIELDMKGTVDSIRKAQRHEASSHAFASLFLWKYDMGLAIHLEEDFFAVSYGKKEGWFFPCGCREKKRAFIEELKSGKPFSLYYLRKEDAEFLEQEFPGEFVIAECPGSHEYIYERMAFEQMQGRRYAKLRNHISQAERKYSLSVKRIEKDDLPVVREILLAWIDQKENKEMLLDKQASPLLVDKWEELNLTGILVALDGMDYAAVAGYALSDNSMDMAFAKQRGMANGVSVYAKRAFVSSLPDNFVYINAEEDLGLDGLRKMKQQMQPLCQIKMYKAEVLT